MIRLILCIAGFAGITMLAVAQVPESSGNPAPPLPETTTQPACPGGGFGMGGNTRDGITHVYISPCALLNLLAQLRSAGLHAADQTLDARLQDAIALLESLEGKQDQWLDDLDRSRKNQQDLLAMLEAGNAMDAVIEGHNRQVRRHASYVQEESQALEALMSDLMSGQKRLDLQGNAEADRFLLASVDILVSLNEYRDVLGNWAAEFAGLVIDQDAVIQ